MGLGRLIATLSVLAPALTAALVAPAAAGDAGTDAGFPQCDRPLDVLFLFDTTGSMGGVIASAKSGASSIMANVNAAVPGTTFGVANYKDYDGFYSWPGYSDWYGGFGDYPWMLNQGLTTDTTLVQAGIGTLSASGGADWPESLSRGLWESQFMSWRPGSVRLVVLFADAPPHDDSFSVNYGMDPGPDAVIGTADDLDYNDVVADLVATGINVVVVDSGGGNAEEWFRYATSTTGGAYALLGGDFVAQVTQLILDLAPQPGHAARAVALRGESSVPANPYVDVIPVQSGPATGEMSRRLLGQAIAPLNGWIAAANDTSSGTVAEGAITAYSRARVADFSLHGGLVRGRDVEATATATTTSTGTSASGASIVGELIVNGNVLTAAQPPNTIVPIPGVGVVILNEQRVHTDGTGASEILVNAVHLVLDTAMARGDVVVASAYAGAACDGGLGAVLATFDNDMGAGGDAPDDPAAAAPVANPSAFQGRLVDMADTGDAYRIAAAPGMKVAATLVPSTRAGASANPLPTAPTAVAAIPDLKLRLREPGSLAVRLESDLPLSAPERVELNVDVAGDWVVEVLRATAVPANYTIALTVTPILLDAQDDAGSGGDAPDSCAPALAIGSGEHRGVLRDSDYTDWYRVRANIGDLAAFAVKPTEDADGADFDLFVYDSACALLASSTLGKGIIPKGTPDAVAFTPVTRSDDYRVEVRRMNGIGNYYLTVDVTDPQPTVAPVDAESSGDAGADPAGARPVATPAVAQGRFPDGDDEDWYSFTVTAGDRVTITVTPQVGSPLVAQLLRPDLTVAASAASVAGTPVALSHKGVLGGTWYLRLDGTVGGGDYAFTVVTEPA